MKTSTLARLFALAAASAAFGAHAAEPACIQVEVQNLRPQEGVLMVAAYTDAAGYKARKWATSLQVRAGASTTQSVQLCGLSGESVALSMYQDLNGNGKLDTSILGMPTEPWGASGKPSAMSAPTWETTQVPLAAGATIVVKLSQ
jgi:uncharacterized protein (DUF2141 family)